MKIARQRKEKLRQEIVALLPRLRRFARGLAGDPDKGDDLVQAACERALKRLEQVRDGSRLDSWLYRIIYTQWIDRMRRSASRSACLKLIAEGNPSAACEADSDKCMASALDVRKALKGLTTEHQAAILLVCLEGYSYAEASKVLDVPVGTVASRVARARSILCNLLYPEKTETFQFSQKEIKKGRK